MQLNFEPLFFLYESYTSNMVEKFGEDISTHPPQVCLKATTSDGPNKN